MGRMKGSGRFTEKVQVQVEPTMRERVEDIVERDSVHHPSFSHVVRESLEGHVPTIEKALDDAGIPPVDRSVEDEGAA